MPTLGHLVAKSTFIDELILVAGLLLSPTTADLVWLALARQRSWRESEARFHHFAEASGDWFWEMDAELRLTRFSPEVEKHASVPPEWHYGKTRQEIGASDVPKEVGEEHLETLAVRQP